MERKREVKERQLMVEGSRWEKVVKIVEKFFVSLPRHT